MYDITKNNLAAFKNLHILGGIAWANNKLGKSTLNATVQLIFRILLLNDVAYMYSITDASYRTLVYAQTET
jgi:hypothetical protein